MTSMAPPHRSSPDFGNGDRGVPDGKTPEENARIAANAALNCEYAIGGMMRELASTRTAQATFQTNVSAFMAESREAFKQLGVKVRKSEQRIEQKIDAIDDEIEDTKTRNLREYRRKYNWWKKTFIGSAIAVIVGVVTLMVGHYVFHIG